jgi:L-ribulose-5-phosphate 3-epimerase
MQNTISFVTANFIARECGYDLEGAWDDGQAAVEAYFRPPATFEERFDALLAEVAALGFAAVDIWLAHLSPAWATPEQVSAARRCLTRQGLRPVSLAGYFGSTLPEFEAYCRLAAGLGTPILGGVAPVLGSERDGVIALLRTYGLVLAIENHYHGTARQLLAEIGPGPVELVGACVDTGSFATHCADAAEAIEELGSRVLHVHFRDVVPDGSDRSMRFGEGCVPLPGCVAALRRAGYRGAISVEHEPEDHDPRADCRAGLLMLKEWLA